MSKHTPGPWWVEIDDETASWAEQWPRIVSENYEVVGTEGLYGDFETDCANARLIAASPELLDVVQGFRRKLSTYVSVYPGDKELRQLLVECDAVILKATGEQQ